MRHRNLQAGEVRRAHPIKLDLPGRNVMHSSAISVKAGPLAHRPAENLLFVECKWWFFIKNETTVGTVSFITKIAEEPLFA